MICVVCVCIYVCRACKYVDTWVYVPVYTHTGTLYTGTLASVHSHDHCVLWWRAGSLREGRTGTHPPSPQVFDARRKDAETDLHRLQHLPSYLAAAVHCSKEKIRVIWSSRTTNSCKQSLRDLRVNADLHHYMTDDKLRCISVQAVNHNGWRSRLHWFQTTGQSCIVSCGSPLPLNGLVSLHTTSCVHAKNKAWPVRFIDCIT